MQKSVANEKRIVTGLQLNSSAYLISTLQKAEEKTNFVCVLPTETDAKQLYSDVKTYFPLEQSTNTVLHIPALDISPYAELSGDRIALRLRMASLYRLSQLSTEHGHIIICSIASLMQKVLPKKEFLYLCDTIEVNTEIDRDLLLASLVAAGYLRTTFIEQAGQFSVRGGVVDIFVPSETFPIRIELFGDDVESIRTFDIENQRTLRQLKSVSFHPVRQTMATRGNTLRNRILEAADICHHPSKRTRNLLERIQEGDEFIGIENLTPAFHHSLTPLYTLFPINNLHWILWEPGQIEARADDSWADSHRRYDDRIENHQIAFPPEDHYVNWQEVSRQAMDAFPILEFHSLHVEGSKEPYAHIPTEDNIALRSQIDRLRKTKSDNAVKPLLKEIRQWQAQGQTIIIACQSSTRQARMHSLLQEYGIDVLTQDTGYLDFSALQSAGAPLVARAQLSSGFTLPTEALVVLSDEEIFGPKAHSKTSQRRAAQRAREALKGGVTDFSQLRVDDYLVHMVHGVGQYKGLKKLPIQDIPIDFLHLEYRGGNLYLPVVRIGEVQRYVGAAGLHPRLDKLGGDSFTKSKRAVSKKVHALAEALLQLYAERAALPGHAFPSPDSLYYDFETSFEFEETPDQQKAIDEIQEDMGTAKPMDRLVCGDVGYGKTEVALRAILRAVLGGKQVAFLAPTTVLVEQHYQTMKKRFDRWPIRIARLSRFQKKKQQLETLSLLATGQVDAVVGTHRLLSKDVRFKDLGLLVIDEEQRFGVTHKERFKKMRASIDVLTLTATPIPRTLHLAMTGLRDLSIIATPPADRRSIRTFVARNDDNILREALERELARKGQIFFVSPRIDNPVSGGERSLEEWAAHLKQLVPKANVVLAHGRLAPDKLEKIMVAFVEGKYDILVSTTIVEAGLDIPRANTMFIDRADRFGLSQLYQLRGRIGRSNERAYCYLLVPEPDKLNDDARKRLATLQRYTELGAGFAIASQDLEIRGAGELLGGKQSGSIAAIGFDAYTQMLEEAVAELQGSPIRGDKDPELNVDVPGYIPDDYVPDTAQRLALYKRLASAADEEEVRELLEEIVDCYGCLPPEVGVLGQLMVLKNQAKALHTISLELNAMRMVLALESDTPLDRSKVMQLIKKPCSLYRLTPDMRLVRNFSKMEQERPVETAKSCLMELRACVTSLL